MLGTGNFPNFFGKYPVLGKWHSGTQTSKLLFIYFKMFMCKKGFSLLPPFKTQNIRCLYKSTSFFTRGTQVLKWVFKNSFKSPLRCLICQWRLKISLSVCVHFSKKISNLFVTSVQRRATPQVISHCISVCQSLELWGHCAEAQKCVHRYFLFHRSWN